MGWKCMESSVKKYAVIDLGSNTIRISVYEVQEAAGSICCSRRRKWRAWPGMWKREP